jgi:transcriptional regulator with XRE-family HTH domain
MLGEKIKKTRNEKGFSLRDLAAMVDLSASFLSQIEQGKASPSIENLKKIANCLDVRVSYLIEDDEIKKDTVMVRKSERDTVESIDSNTKISLLTSSDIDKNMEPIYYEIGPMGESGRDSFQHPGEEFVFVLEGELDVYINEKKYQLEEGDSLYFKSSQKHKFTNPTSSTTKVLWVVTPPTF